MGFPFSLEIDTVESKLSSLEPFSTTKSHIRCLQDFYGDTSSASAEEEQKLKCSQMKV